MTDESDHVRLVLIEGQIKEIKEAMEVQTRVTQDLVDAWRSAKTLLAFIQLLAKIATACGVLWLTFKGFMSLGADR